jgi:hypothetical protein
LAFFCLVHKDRQEKAVVGYVRLTGFFVVLTGTPPETIEHPVENTMVVEFAGQTRKIEQWGRLP